MLLYCMYCVHLKNITLTELRVNCNLQKLEYYLMLKFLSWFVYLVTNSRFYYLRQTQQIEITFHIEVHDNLSKIEHLEYLMYLNNFLRSFLHSFRNIHY